MTIPLPAVHNESYVSTTLAAIFAS